MTKIECIKMVLKCFRGSARVFVCGGLGVICKKINNNADVTALHRGTKKGIKDIMDVFKAFDLNKEYAEAKEIYDEL